MNNAIKNHSLTAKYMEVSDMRHLRVALCQMNSTVGDLTGNVDKMKKMIDTSKMLGAELVVFPELAIPGYPPQDALLYDGLNRDM